MTGASAKTEATTSGSTPRLAHLDVAWARQLLAYSERRSDEALREPSEAAPTQTDLALLAGLLLDKGRLVYALGKPLAEVRNALHQAAQTYVKVFRQRGSSERIPIAEVNAAPGWQRDFHDNSAEPEGTDESLTNSRTGLLALHLCLATGDIPLAEELAHMVFDPVGASYLGSSSEVCTFADQKVAYALRDLVLGQGSAAGNRASTGNGRVDEEQRLEMLAIAACLSQDSQLVSGTIKRLIAFFDSQAGRQGNEKNMDCFLCLPALSLASLAKQRGLLGTSELPPASASFPAELFTEAPSWGDGAKDDEVRR